MSIRLAQLGKTQPPLFHIGYHKTGTTFLQKYLFERFEFFYRVPQREIFWNLVYPHPMEFSVEDCRDFIGGHVSEAGIDKAITVFSNERLSGGHHTGGQDSVELADRIHKCCPDARILLFVREQKSLLLSLYAQYVKGMGCVSLEEYLNPTYTKHRKQLFNPVTLEFDRLVAEYKQRFDKVLVLPYESLKAQPEFVIAQILEYAGVPQKLLAKHDTTPGPAYNVARAPVLQRVDRYLHPFRSRNIPHVGSTYSGPLTRTLARVISRAASFLPLGALDRRLKRKDVEYISRFAGDRYSASNQRLSDMIGTDLRKFGYF